MRGEKGIRVCGEDGADVEEVGIGIKTFKEVCLVQRFDDTTRNDKGLLWILKERVKGQPIDVSSLSTVSSASASITSTTSALGLLEGRLRVKLKDNEDEEGESGDGEGDRASLDAFRGVVEECRR